MQRPFNYIAILALHAKNMLQSISQANLLYALQQTNTQYWKNKVCIKLTLVKNERCLWLYFRHIYFTGASQRPHNHQQNLGKCIHQNMKRPFFYSNLFCSHLWYKQLSQSSLFWKAAKSPLRVKHMAIVRENNSMAITSELLPPPCWRLLCKYYFEEQLFSSSTRIKHTSESGLKFLCAFCCFLFLHEDVKPKPKQQLSNVTSQLIGRSQAGLNRQS